jgi:adenine-specific DNA-methyltransferase
MINQKENGSYYTPEIISDFIVKRIFDTKFYKLPKKISVLEPSVGDGIFIQSLLNNAISKKTETALEIVERDSEELEKAISLFKGSKNKKIKLESHLQDFLEFQKTNQKKYDLVIGNPPYIKKNHLTRRQLELCEKIHQRANLSDKKIKNIWTAFLISGVESLTENGIISFVLPAELLQVSYAKELRDYLRKTLHKIEVFAFNELVFDGIEQDVIIIIGTKSSKQKGVSFFQANKLTDLKKPHLIPGNTNIDRDTLDKWTNYILSEEELNFLDSFKKDIKAVKDYAKVQVGIVTAANNFFIVDKSVVDKFELKPYVKKILQKSSLLPQSLSITQSDFSVLEKKGKPVFLLALPDEGAESLPKKIRDYIKAGEDKKVHTGYKCVIRNNWFHVSSVWASEGLFIKRSNLFPRILVNSAKIMVTDAFYRISMKDGFDIKSLSFCFFNSLTFVFTELEGRYYGGGVLELVPNEFKNISVPYFKIKDKNIEKLDEMLRSKKPLEEILKFTNQVVLKEKLNLSEKQVNKINEIYTKLVKRRLKFT